MYGLTHAAIVDALLAANLRGVDVALKTDKIKSAGRAQSAMIAKLQAAGLPVEVIDGRYIVTESFNWTENAERRNRENMVVLDCPSLASDFSAEWDSIQCDKP